MAGASNTPKPADTSSKNGNGDGSSSTNTNGRRPEYPKGITITHLGQSEAKDENTFNVKFYTEDQKIYTTLTSKTSSVDRWIDDVYRSFPNQIKNQNLLVGLDIEWVRLRGQTGEPNKVAVLQLSLARKCLIFQFLDCYDDEDVPVSLAKFLGDKRIVFVGSGIDHDARKLWVDWKLTVARSEELAGYADYKLGRSGGLSKAGLKALMMEVVGDHLPKPRRLTLSRWDGALWPDQVMYACLDAYASFRIGMELRRPKKVNNNRYPHPQRELTMSPKETNQGQGFKTANQGARGSYKKTTTTNVH